VPASFDIGSSKLQQLRVGRVAHGVEAETTGDTSGRGDDDAKKLNASSIVVLISPATSHNGFFGNGLAKKSS
jgi:hypothetical protein